MSHDDADGSATRYRALEEGETVKSTSSRSLQQLTATPRSLSRLELRPDTMTLDLEPFEHEVTSVNLGNDRAFPVERSVLVPPLGFERLELEYDQANRGEFVSAEGSTNQDDGDHDYDVEGDDAASVDDAAAAPFHVDSSSALNGDASSSTTAPLLNSDADSFPPVKTAASLTSALKGGRSASSKYATSKSSSAGVNLDDYRNLKHVVVASSSSSSSSSTGADADAADSSRGVGNGHTRKSVYFESEAKQSSSSSGNNSGSVMYSASEDHLDDDDEDGPNANGGGDSTTIDPGSDSAAGSSASASASSASLSSSSSSSSSSASSSASQSTRRRSLSQAGDKALNPYRALLRKGHKLGEFRATAICGNDATGSVFYMIGPCVSKAGVFAPVSVALVAFILYMFRAIYGEAVTSLPLNGGAYNVLLNTTKKSTASIAAVLTLLSYTATAVVSAAEAIHYLDHVIELPSINTITWLTIILLLLFALLNLVGIGESASVALAIFLLHLATLVALCIAGIVRLSHRGFDRLKMNYHDGPYTSISRGIFYGYSAAMLGITGFETSANYVEEQKPGVYMKTLRNMWWLCTIFNIISTGLAVALCDINSVILQDKVPTIVAVLAQEIGGDWFETWVSIDAFLVLAGGVLTSYVGVTGLVRRLALDRCLPQVFLNQNEWRGTNHWIILGFFLLCTSMYLALDHNVKSLGDTYSVAFLAVMGLFAFGLMLLKVKRSTLKSEVTASWLVTFLAIIAVCAGLVGAAMQEPGIIYVFLLYFFAAFAIICVMFFRYQLLKLGLYFARLFPCACLNKPESRVQTYLSRTMTEIRDRPMGFFAKFGKLSVLNKAVLYVRENEDCSWLRIIHVYESEAEIPPTLYRNVHFLNEQYPKMKIDLVLVKGRFSPAMVAYISLKLDIPRNYLFITTPQPGFAHKLEDLGGVRLITH